MTTRNGRESFARLSRDQLAVLVPELLLCGQLIDRSGMPHVIGAFGRPGMTEVAIEEWQVSSPVYTRRMQQALGFAGDDVETIFKGLQLDIGAPPQFMDFRFRVDDHDHGEFWLDHCGALMDVEPMGDEYVFAMCHEIEDPTFDATALATNPHAQVRPIHRPPRNPAGRHPHCAWTVRIDPANVPPPVPPNSDLVANSRAAGLALSPIDPADPGNADYSGPLLSDLRFGDFSHSALVRIAEEVCLQQHLLTLGFLIAVGSRTDEGSALDIGRKTLTGVAGLSAERIRNALGLGIDLVALAQVVDLHPVFNPKQYVQVSITDGEALTVRVDRGCAGVLDGSWPALLDADHLEPIEALVRGVNPRFTVTATSSQPDALEFRIELGDKAFPESSEVALTRFSSGADFSFVDRGTPLPLTVVSHR